MLETFMLLKQSWIYSIFKRSQYSKLKISDSALVGEGQGASTQLSTNGDITVDWKEGVLFGTVTIRQKGSQVSIPGISKSNRNLVYELQILSNLSVFHQAKNEIDTAYSEHAYISDSQYRTLRKRYANLVVPQISKLYNYQLLSRNQISLIKFLHNFLTIDRWSIDEHNRLFVEHELEGLKGFFDTIEKYPLTSNQRLAVLHDEDHSLVIAGAGTGKTSTIVAKVEYIIQRKLATPDEVLVLAFTAKAAEELKERLSGRDSQDCDIRTFHSLGYMIVGKAEGRKPSIAKEAEDTLALIHSIEQIVGHLLNTNEDFERAFLDFTTLYQYPYRSIYDFENQGEYYEYIKNQNIRTLKGELVKSLEECEIANWLYRMGINYEYEREYEHDTATSDFRQYQPDFYLPDYKFYIEHFAVDENYATPKFIDQKKYVEGIKWKRDLHQSHETTLIETYSYYRRDGILIDKLHEALKQYRVEYHPIPTNNILDILNEQGRINTLHQLIARFLTLYKEGLYSISKIKSTIKKDDVRSTMFLKVFELILNEYNSNLSKSNLIDFGDMIGRAVGCIRSQRYNSQYKYIIIDEYQDISRGRAILIKELLGQVTDSKLFCVGDDWQSIFRFAGSDLSMMTQFARVYGYTYSIGLDRTFRYGNRLSRLSSHFILKNDTQLTKELHSELDDSTNVPVVITPVSDENRIRVILSVISDLSGDEKTSVLVLNRYNNDNLARSEQRRISAAFDNIDVKFMTAHKSKGLEADYVIIDNMKTGVYGFPCEIEDDPLLRLVIVDPDKHPHAEERRLFYVALTRARKQVYIATSTTSMSTFVQELLEDSSYEVDSRIVGYLGDLPCPKCTGGRLLRRQAESGEYFFSCSNFPLCEYTEGACPSCGNGYLHRGTDESAMCISCGHTERLCPRCNSGTMHLRRGRFGNFCACSDKEGCGFVESLCPACKKGSLAHKGDGLAVCRKCGNQEQICPKCGLGYIMQKNGRYGPFYGCSRYSAKLDSCDWTSKS